MAGIGGLEVAVADETDVELVETTAPVVTGDRSVVEVGEPAGGASGAGTALSGEQAARTRMSPDASRLTGPTVGDETRSRSVPERGSPAPGGQALYGSVSVAVRG